GPGVAAGPARPTTELEARVIRQISARLAYRLLRLEVQRLDRAVPPHELDVHPIGPEQVAARSRWFLIGLDVGWDTQRGPRGPGAKLLFMRRAAAWASHVRDSLEGFARQGLGGEVEGLEDLTRFRQRL